MGLKTFLLARIAEDEAVVSDAFPAYVGLEVITVDDAGNEAVSISRERLRSECAAKRAIVEMHDIGTDPCDAHDASFESIHCDTIRTLAAVYADHPDYQPEWAV